MYLPLAEDYQHRIAASLENGIVICADEDLLTQMFTNLIENPIHHAPDDTHIRLHLGTATAFRWPSAMTAPGFRRIRRSSGHYDHSW
jgi:signal transduction histidine kinase